MEPDKRRPFSGDSNDRRDSGKRTSCTCVVDGRFDPGAVSDDRRVLDQPADVPRSHSCDLGNVEAVKHLLKRVPFPEHDLPAQPGLEQPRV